MSRDFLSTRIRTGSLIGSNEDSQNLLEPKLIIYSEDFASDHLGGQTNDLEVFLQNSNI